MITVRKSQPWRAIYKSWYSPDIYREAAHSWRGLGFQFLIIELLVLWSITAIHVQVETSKFVGEYLIPVVKALPKIVIKDGLLSTEPPVGVLRIRDPRDNRAIINFDLAAEPMPPPETDGVFVEQKRIIFHAGDKRQTYDFDSMKDAKFEWEMPLRMLTVAQNWIGVAVLGIFWLSSFVLCALQVLVYGLAGKVAAMLLKRRLTYSQLVRIAVVAMTPSLIIDTCQKLLCMGIPAWSFVALAVTLGYLVFGVKVNSVAFEWALSQGVSSETTAKNSAV